MIHSFSKTSVVMSPGDAFWVRYPKNEPARPKGARISARTAAERCYQTCYHFPEKAARNRMNQGPTGWAISLK
jgi:hypothetical protein